MKYKAKDIFTPQGLLEDVEKNPNLDFLMNIFNIPRAFGVSGFGQAWNVGMHSMATAFIALYWAKYNKFSEDKTNRLVVQALLHDVHEAVTGDILPMFKSSEVKKELQSIQKNIIHSLQVEEDNELEKDLKICDLTAFLYEIKQVSPTILNPKKLLLAKTIAQKQQKILMIYARENKISSKKIVRFLKFISV